MAAEKQAQLRPIVTRAEAEALGLKRYFTGKPCKRGHIANRETGRGACMECRKESDRASRGNRADQRREYNQKYRAANKDKCIALTKAWRATSVDQIKAARKAYREANKERLRAEFSAWRVANVETEKLYRQREEVRAASAARTRKKYRTPEGCLNARMSSRLRSVLKSGKQRKSWISLVDYTANDLRAHIERQFLKGMSWENKGEWHIDHIIPLSSFSFSSPDDPDFKAAWALTNLRPLWARQNISKSNKRELLL